MKQLTSKKSKILNFSFILPLYNCEKYVRDMVNSILKMNRHDYEIILINDGSQDDTELICTEICQKYAEVRYYYQTNSGVSSARNYGLEKAQGDYIIFLDADDHIDSSKMNRLLEQISRDPQVDMAIYGMSFDYFYHGKCYRSEELSAPLNGVVDKENWIRQLDILYSANALSPLWNKVIKRSILVENQLKLKKDMFLYEDLEFSLQCMAFCDAIFFSPEIIYHYRQSEDEGNAGRRLKKIQHINTLVEKIENALKILQEKNIDIYDIESEKINILLTLYLVLAKIKISVSGRKEIRQICKDFKLWIKSHKIEAEKNFYYEMLVKGQVGKLILRRNYGALRHKLAVKVKNTNWYQKRQ